MEAPPPGVSGEGFGASRNRMKKANFSTPLKASSGELASVLVTSLGTAVYWHSGVSSRSVWNNSLLMPISTL